MLDHISANGGNMLEVAAVLVPAIVLLWIILTVSALYKRDAYFWSLGSTWTSVIACPVAMVIMSLGSWSQANGPDAPLFHAPIVAGAILYLVAFGYSILYNYRVTKSAVLAVSTSMLQQLAVLGAIFLFLRWRGDEVSRGRWRIHRPIRLSLDGSSDTPERQMPYGVRHAPIIDTKSEDKRLQ